MRLWSLHPRYFDQQTLTDLWRDSVRAARLIQDGKAGPYPQLERFLTHPRPVHAICDYMHQIANVGEGYGWSKRWLFDRAVIPRAYANTKSIPVTAGQMELETWHYGELICKKLGGGQRYVDFWSIMEPEPHPLFTIVSGAIEKWEKLSHDGYTQCKECGGPIYYNGQGSFPTRCEHCRRKRS